MPDAPVTAADHQKAIEREYGQYVAVTPIDINGGRAFNAGDPVPASHVDNGLVRKDQVVGAKTQTAAVLAEKG